MIVELILKNYIPLYNKGIKEVKLDLNNELNVIVGPNGFGKSSILTECTPLPPDNAMYLKEGFKLIKLIHNDKLYTLTSYAGGKSKHSFVVNNKELNEGGTQKAQLNLVKEHFGLTPNLNKILQGIHPKSVMSVLPIQTRKDLFMSLYPNDVSYGLQVYNNMKTDLRDINGALKNQKNRLVEEQANLERLNKSSTNDLELIIANLEKEIKYCFVLQGMLANKEDLNETLKANIKELGLLTKSLILGKYNTRGILSRKHLEESINAYENLSRENRASINILEKMLNEIHDGVNGLSMMEVKDNNFENKYKLLNDDIKEKQNELNDIVSTLKEYPYFKDSENILVSEFFNKTKTMINLLDNLITKPTKDITIDKYMGLTNDLNKQDILVKNIKEQTNKINHNLKHYEELKSVECPNCDFKFKPGVDEKEITKLNNRLTELNNKLVLEENVLNKLSNLHNEYGGWYENAIFNKRVIKYELDNQSINELFEVYDIDNSDNSLLVNALKHNYKGVKITEELRKLNDEKDILKQRIELLKSNDFISALNKAKTLEEELSVLSNNNYRYKNKLTELNKLLKSQVEYDESLKRIVLLKELIMEQLVKNTNYKLYNDILNRTSELTKTKDEMVKDIIKNNSLNSVICSIKEDIDSLSNKYEVLKGLLDGLCPNKGLIGNMMSDFIKTVCGNINSIVKDIWLRPLFVKPCKIEDGDLTYNFPVVSGDVDTDIICSDVSDCSAGERDMLNFAFRYIICKYFDSDYPLFMDEIGTFMDEVHRERFYEYIKELLNNSHVKQIFMVSHYARQYDVLTNANIINLDTDNMTVGGIVNKNCIIKKI